MNRVRQIADRIRDLELLISKMRTSRLARDVITRYN